MKPLATFANLLPEAVRSLLKGPAFAADQHSRLAQMLGLDELASLRMGKRYHYRPCVIPKPDGGKRHLLAPSPALKALQRRLLATYLSRIDPHGSIMAFRRGGSIVANAYIHSRQRLIATVDLRDFFESTKAARVRSFFRRQGWHDDELGALMRLCVFRNGLPQGAPTSPCLSNLVNIPLDHRLAELAARSGARYTRYGDDLTFSWSDDRLPGGFCNAVESCLHGAGYEIQPKKGWKVTPIADQPVVTGLVLLGDGVVTVPWSVRWRRARLWWQSWWSSDPGVLPRLRGYRAYERMVRQGARWWS